MDELKDKGQVTSSAAEIYEEFFTPALFKIWASNVADAAKIQTGWNVLDVATGTGILAREIINRVGHTGSVTGLDINDSMLAVARSKSTEIEWKQGRAEAIPFDDATFDVVVSQFGLMFFEDRKKSIAEMVRVLKPDGKLAVAVWDALENTPGYLAMVDLLLRLFGDEAANGLRAPYDLGDVNLLKPLFKHNKLKDVKIETQLEQAKFPSLEGWMFTDIKGWVLADKIDDEQYAILLKEAKTVLADFVREDGTVSFNTQAHIITVTKA